MSKKLDSLPPDLLTPRYMGQGIDIVELARIERMVNEWGDRFLNRIYTARELTRCRGRITSLAGRFAAKEAFVKAIGTGLRGMGWKDIEIVNHRSGRPYFVLHGGALKAFTKGGWKSCTITITHSAGVAFAMVSVMKKSGDAG